MSDNAPQTQQPRSLWQKVRDFFYGPLPGDTPSSKQAAEDAARRLGIVFEDAIYCHAHIQFDLADRLRILVRGQVEVSMTVLTRNRPGEVMTRPAHIYVKGLLPTRPPDMSP